MRFRLDSWRADYAFPYEVQVEELDPPVTQDAVDLAYEAPVHDWAPITPHPATPPFAVIRFVDGVQCSDAVIWIDDPGARQPLPGLVASWGAGVIASRPTAPGRGQVELERLVVERGVFSDARSLGPIMAGNLTWRPRTPDTAADGPGPTAVDPGSLRERLGQARRRLEAAVGRIDDGDPDGLVVYDGLLPAQVTASAPSGRSPAGTGPPPAIGLAKRAHRIYLPEDLQDLQRQLRRGQRTPLFVTDAQRRRVSCYVALGDPLPPAVAEPGSCVARIEFAVTPSTSVGQAVAFADRVTAALPAYASEPHIDPRAPQNLMPIRSLEAELRRLLGRPSVIRPLLATEAALTQAVSIGHRQHT